MYKILLVDEDQMIADIYKKNFESAGFEVLNAVDGKEALKLASEEKFDLILLDMVLPGMSGIDVLKELRGNSIYDKDLKVIILSNLRKDDNEKEAKENGASEFIEKTQYSPAQLVAEIQRLLNEYDEQKKNKERLNGSNVASGSCNGKRILFIEDEEIFLEMFGKKLESEGFCLEYAKNGAWGSKLASENKYDLIITDMVMPAMGGEEIIRRIKLDDKTKDIPIIVLSASLIDEDIQPVREMGINDFFEKTRLVPSDLARRVEEILK